MGGTVNLDAPTIFRRCSFDTVEAVAYDDSCYFHTICIHLSRSVHSDKHFSLGETWMDNACMQCTCLHPVGVGFLWFGVRVEPATCKVSLVQTADPRLPCYPGDDFKDPSHGSLQLDGDEAPHTIY
uniref:Uncharacterized protein n=1 Tax=Scophthalmus maximus TaxID=52904 RepID=A0A8D3A478_SCOMX